MKKIILTAAVALLVFASVAPSSQAYESRRRDEPRNRRHERESDYRQLRAELYHLDMLFSRVDSQLRTEPAGTAAGNIPAFCAFASA